jgi:hypothetical protein
MEVEDGISVHGQRSMDCSGSMYYTYRKIKRRPETFGSKVEENNIVLSLKLSITKCVKGSYSQEIMG